MMKPLLIAGRAFKSRLFLGTGKFSSSAALRSAIEASGTELVTVALRRVDVSAEADDILSAIDRSRVTVMLNTSGARNADEALRIARFGRAAGFEWIKLEIHPDPTYLLPDPVETLAAAEQLVKEGFVVLPYINADPVLAKRLTDVGAHAVMPLGAPIGSNLGLQTAPMIRIIIEQSTVPVIVDAGLGLPSHAAAAIEMGADAILVNTAVAAAGDPER
ncbi:MAG: thiazole synthase, partial [Lentisphaerae bacterium GWF2_52_8]